MLLLCYLLLKQRNSEMRFDDDNLLQEEITSLRVYGHRLKSEKSKNHHSHHPKNKFDPMNWQQNIDDQKSIFSLNIPGTHETCARVGVPRLHCQDLSVREQLNSGIRYLDIRCRHINNVFLIHHDYLYEQIGFGLGVLDACIEFLKLHPTEFIFMQIKEEYIAENNTRTFSETMQTYIKSFKDFFYLNEGVPTVEQVRGKIILLRRFSPVVELQGNLLEFQDNAIFTSNTTIVARIQDCYIVPSMLDRSIKWSEMMQLFQEALVNTDSNKLFINFGSGGSDDCHPYAVAEYINPLLGYYLEFGQPNSFIGFVLFDFVNRYYNNLIEIVATRNYS